jgi:hypothetical protein
MIIDRMLTGRRVLVAHESAFQGSYLGEVLRAAGASVIGPVESGREGLALLGREANVHAMVLSEALSDQAETSLLSAAIDDNIRVVVVHEAGVDVAPSFADHRCLATPYAGFQVVAALADVLATTRGGVHWSVRGH